MIDSNLQAYWAAQESNPDQAGDIVLEALDSPPPTAKLTARVLQVARSASLAPVFRARLPKELEPLLESQRLRLRQIDQIANPETDPSAIAEILGEEADAIDWSFDPDQLRSRRAATSNKADGAEAFLEALGWGALPDSTAAGLRGAIEELRAQQVFEAQALLVDPRGNGFVLGLNLSLSSDGEIRTEEAIDEQMARQAAQALHVAFDDSLGARFDLEWHLPLEGASIGLAVLVAAHVAKRDVIADPLSAATGTVGVDGQVGSVVGIAGKLEAAALAGFRRVLVPEANRTEAEAAAQQTELELHFVSEASEVRRILTRVPPGTPLSVEAKKRVLRGSAKEFGFEVSDEGSISHGYQFKLTDLGGTAAISLYDSGKIVVGGGAAVKARAEQLVEKRLPNQQPEPRSPLSLKVEIPERRQAVAKALIGIDAEEKAPGDHEQWRYRVQRGLSSAAVVLYSSGKLVLQGNAPAWDDARSAISEELSDLSGGEALSATPALQVVRERREKNKSEPWIGTDESGKGDFFGPLVSAAVFTTPETAEQLKGLGAADSKKLTDKRVFELAPQLNRTLGKAATVTAIHPERFNSFYSELRQRGQKLNTMLAWGHTRSIENLLRAQLQPAYAIVDQFADVSFINGELLAETRRSELEILQFPKAEMDVAVAAASILAREAFLKWLQKASAEIGIVLPKGAGPPVIEAGKELVAKHGPEELGKYAKLFFKTTNQVLAQ